MSKQENLEDPTIKLNQTIKELQTKLIVLKKALLEERDKSSNFEKQVEELKVQLYEKDCLIQNYKTEINTLNESISKSNPKEYYKKMFGDENEINIDNLKEENNKLNNELKDYQEQNGILKEKLESLTLDIDNIKQESKIKIENLEKEFEKEKKNFEQEKERLTIIEGLSKNFDNQKIFYENKISELNNQVSKLQNINNQLKTKNSNYSNTIMELQKQKKEIENENCNLSKKLEETININEDYIFIGSIYNKDENENDRKKIMLFFGKFQDKIEITFENGSMDFPIQKIPSIYKIKDKKEFICLTLMDNNDQEKKFICQFSERECNFIIKFYDNMKKKYNENNEQVTMMTYNIDNFTF